MPRPPHRRRHHDRPHLSRRTRLLLAIAPLLAPTPLFAQTAATWLSPASGTWSDPLNWSTNPAYPNDPTADAYFTAAGSPYTVTLDSPVSLHSLTGTSPDASLNLTYGGTLTLSSTLDLGPGSLTLTGGTLAGGTLSSPVTSNSGTLDSLSLASELTVLGYAATAGTFSLAGGTIRLARHTTVSVAGPSLSGTGTVVFDSPTSAATLRPFSPSASFTIAPGVTVRTGSGSGVIALGSLTLLNQGTISAQTPGKSVTLDGKWSNAGTLEATNNATLLLGGDFTPADLGTLSTSTGGAALVTGDFHNLASPFILSSSHTIGLGPEGWILGGSLATPDNTPLVVHPATSSNASYLAGADVDVPVVLQPGAIFEGPGSTFRRPLTGSGATLNLITGTPTLTAASRLADSTINVHVPLNSSFLNLITRTNTPVNLSAPLTNTDRTLTLDATTGPLNIKQFGSITGGTVGTSPDARVNILPGTSGTLTSNITLTGTLAINSNSVILANGLHLADGHLVLDSTGGGGAGVTIDSLSGTGDITFDGTGGASQVNSPGASLLSLPAGVTARTGTASGALNSIALAGTLSAETPGRTLSASGSIASPSATLQAINGGTLNVLLGLSGTTLAAGTFLVGDNSTILLGSFTTPLPVRTNAASVTLAGPTSSFPSLDTLSTNSGSFTLTDGRSFTTQSDLTNTGSLTLGPASSLTVTGTLTNSGSLSLAPTATLSLAAGPLLWTHPDPASSPAGIIRQYLHDHQLTSPAADPAHRLAYTDSGTTLLVTLTLTGDANLDGVVNADDYALLDRAYARSTTNALWTDGDFNYDGTIDASDYLLIDTTYAQTHPLSPAFLSLRDSQFGPTYVSTLLAAVPEPSCAISLLITLPLFRRRRSNKK